MIMAEELVCPHVMYDAVQAAQCPIWGIPGNWAVLRAQGCAIRGCVLLEPVRHRRSSVLAHAQPRRAPQRRFRPVAGRLGKRLLGRSAGCADGAARAMPDYES